MVTKLRHGLAGVVLLAAGCAGGDELAERQSLSAQPAVAPAVTGQGGVARVPVPDRITEGELPVVTVYKSPFCGCCTDWEEHMRRFGFPVESIEVEDVVPVKIEAGLPPYMASCHTALVDGYAVEGHVPADVVERLLVERPEGVLGIAVPGMPVGSPGMEGPYTERYNIYTFNEAGETEVYASR